MPNFTYQECGHTLHARASGPGGLQPGKCPACIVNAQRKQDQKEGVYRIKALSLYQPYPVAIFLDLKHHETRPRALGCRTGDLVAIYATKTLPTNVSQWWNSRESYEHRRDLNSKLGYVPDLNSTAPGGVARGAILGYCEITGIYQSDQIRGGLSEQELRWGDYSPGRVIYGLKIVHKLERVIPASATQQGLWPVTVQRSLPGVREWIEAQEAREAKLRKGQAE